MEQPEPGGVNWIQRQSSPLAKSASSRQPLPCTDEIPQETHALVEHDPASEIHVGARLLTISEWRALLTEHPFNITLCATASMHLLEVPRLIEDVGVCRALLIVSRLLRSTDVRSMHKPLMDRDKAVDQKDVNGRRQKRSNRNAPGPSR
jgi:hypothetical protein